MPALLRQPQAAGGGGRTLVATDAALAVLAIEPDDAHSAPTGDAEAPPQPEAAHAATVAKLAPRARVGTKQAALISMLHADTGATIAEIAAATGWQAHTVRGAIADVHEKRLGLEVISRKE